jgi:hypothetical protein
VSDDSSHVQALISQLEEQKFLRLFRHLIDNEGPVPTKALDLPDAEFHAKIWPGSRHRNYAVGLFQIAHIPPFLWHPDSADLFLEKEFRRAFTSLRNKDELLARVFEELENEMHEKSSWPYQFPSEGYFHYFFTNAPQTLVPMAKNDFPN